MKKRAFSILFATVLFVSITINVKAQNVAKYNLVYNSPAANSWSSMVCGNGNIASNVWIDTDGVLHFYIGSMDSRDYMGRLLKITEVKVRFSPMIFKDA